MWWLTTAAQQVDESTASTHLKRGDRRRQRRLQIAAFCLTMIVPSISQATGFRIFPQSASGAGQADAFVAQSDDPSAIYYNPAGMTQLPGVQLLMGATLVGGGTDFTGRATGAKSFGSLGGAVANPPPFQFYLTANLKSIAQAADLPALARMRSEERRVGKECRSRWSPY